MSQVVWLGSYPRSGVTFMRHVIERVYQLPTWAAYTGESVASGHLLIEGKKWPHEAIDSPGPCFVKTHALEAPSIRTPAIHLVRDGRDAIVSHAHYLRDFGGDVRALHTLIDMLIDGAEPIWGYWGLHTLAYAGRTAPTATIRFCDLIADPLSTVAGALETLGMDLPICPDADVDDFQALHKRKPRFFRSGAHEQWKTEMTAKQEASFQANHGDALDYYESLAEVSCLTT